MPHTLLVGVGNLTRGDDAAGWQVAERIEALHLPGVEVRTTHQLTPDWAETWSHYHQVVLVDAAIDADRLTWRRLSPENPPGSGPTHAASPRQIAALARELYGWAGCVVVGGLPAACFDLGTPLSDRASRAVLDAVDYLRNWLTSVGQPGPNERHKP